MGHLSFVAWCMAVHVVLHATGTPTHPCFRVCLEDEPPMTCEFNMTVEWFRTLSKACWDCPFTPSDCFRPQCISADGYPRPVITFNRQIPGPPIQVCENDRVVVWVTNELSDGSATSVHWHGIHQRGTPYMDGPAHITQCPIQPLETFRYEFVASPAGTHWYHSHSGLQYGDGAYGPLIVRQAKTVDPHSDEYDADLPEHTLLVADWLPETANTHFIRNMLDVSGVGRWSALINGRARRYEVPDTHNTTGSPSTSAFTPMTTIKVERDVRYRIRVISASQKCTFLFYIDQHPLMVIATDGSPFVPVIVDAIHISPGERYDIIITTNQPTASYWVGAIGHGQCKESNGTTAILKYEGDEDGYPEREPYTFHTYKPEFELGPNPPRARKNKTSSRRKSLSQMNPVHHVNLTDTPADVTYYVGMESLLNDNSVYGNKELYPTHSLPKVKQLLTPVMNNITFRLPPVPLLSQPEDVDEAWFCNRSTVNHTQCQEDLCRCTHRLKAKLGQVVDIVFVVLDRDIEGHPMHLHGYNFYLIAMSETPEGVVTLDDMERLDRQGLLPRKLVNPILKDTIKIPPTYYAIFRFKADNPGIWFFHCHMEDHLIQGKAFVLQVGDYEDFPPLPDVFPRCGGWGTSNSRRQECRDSQNTGGAGSLYASVAVMLYLACVIFVGAF